MKYVTTKIVEANEMSRLEYCNLRGWELPENEKGLAEERVLELIDEDGIVGFSTKETFLKYSSELEEGFTFGIAIELLKQGKKLQRTGWNGKDMWISMTPGKILDLSKDDIWTQNIKDVAIANNGKVELFPYIVMKTADSNIQIGWLASQNDILSNDWYVVE